MRNDIQQRLDHLRQQLQALNDPSRLPELEQQARELLADAKNTPFEAAAQALFADIARLMASPSTITMNPTTRGLLRRARIRIEMAGDSDDIDEAIDILSEVVATNPNDPEVIELLQQSAQYSDAAAHRVRDLFKRYNVSASVPTAAPRSTQTQQRPAVMSTPTPPPRFAAENDDDELAAPPRPITPRSTERVPAASPLDTSERRASTYSAYGDLDEMLSLLTEHYYAGDYQQAIDVANRILSIEPHNSTAQEYRQKAEDNLIRGIVPDHRIPFDARVSYNRANSLVRAGSYDEASKLYREARDLAERDGILSWKDVEQALLDIQDLALARELLNEGDRLMAVDNWNEALRKYEGALRVVPNDPQAEERVDMVRRVQQDADQIAVKLNMLGGTLEDQVTQLQGVRSALARIRQLLPTSQRLAQTQREVDSKLAAVKTQLNDQARAALNRAQTTTNLDDRLTLTHEALRLMEFAVQLDPSDTSIGELMMEARAATGEMQRARQTIERAASHIAQNFDSELTQARTMLAGLSMYAQDERYRVVVNDLLARYMERAELAIMEGDINTAQSWIDAMREDPFRVLGRRSEVFRLEAAVRSLRNRRRAIVGGISGIIGLGLLAIVFISRPQWEAVFFPSETPTATWTATATLTFTPSITPTPSDTPTVTPTLTPSLTFTPTITPSWTWTPSPTWTPSFTPTASLTPTASNTPTETFTPTPTPTETLTPTITPTPTITSTPRALCTIIVNNQQPIFLRSQPTARSQSVTTLPFGTVMEAIERQPEQGGGNLLWYRVRLTQNGRQLEGWVRTDLVGEVPGEMACPPPPR
ncbi:SH3 domain-containing protein [Aggregatilineales bacterium SYSU G02658]